LVGRVRGRSGGFARGDLGGFAGGETCNMKAVRKQAAGSSLRKLLEAHKPAARSNASLLSFNVVGL
jgi:hypothetical protein